MLLSLLLFFVWTALLLPWASLTSMSDADFCVFVQKGTQYGHSFSKEWIWGALEQESCLYLIRYKFVNGCTQYRSQNNSHQLHSLYIMQSGGSSLPIELKEPQPQDEQHQRGMEATQK